MFLGIIVKPSLLTVFFLINFYFGMNQIGQFVLLLLSNKSLYVFVHFKIIPASMPFDERKETSVT